MSVKIVQDAVKNFQVRERNLGKIDQLSEGMLAGKRYVDAKTQEPVNYTRYFQCYENMLNSFAQLAQAGLDGEKMSESMEKKYALLVAKANTMNPNVLAVARREGILEAEKVKEEIAPTTAKTSSFPSLTKTLAVVSAALALGVVYYFRADCLAYINQTKNWAFSFFEESADQCPGSRVCPDALFGQNGMCPIPSKIVDRSFNQCSGSRVCPDTLLGQNGMCPIPSKIVDNRPQSSLWNVLGSMPFQWAIHSS